MLTCAPSQQHWSCLSSKLKYSSARYALGDCPFTAHNALATLHILAATAMSLNAMEVLPTTSQSTRAEQMVRPPPVNCMWPQFSFASSSSTSLESGSAESSRSSSATTSLDGSRVSISVASSIARMSSTAPENLGKSFVTTPVK